MLEIEAFERYYLEIRPGLLRFISVRVRDAHQAQDVMQEVYTKAFRHLERYDQSRPFSTWIYAIARNSCIDHLRRRRRDPLAHAATGASGSVADGSGIPDLDGLPERTAMDPARLAERNDLMVAVRRELAKLPDHRRAAVEMKIVEGLTYREIAAALDAPLGTVAFWVREALDAVARRLEHLR